MDINRPPLYVYIYDVYVHHKTIEPFEILDINPKLDKRE